jgi:hypothetical protein
MCFMVLIIDSAHLGLLFGSTFHAQFLFHLVYCWVCIRMSLLSVLVESMNVFLFHTSSILN